jgi:hypothetical protein
MSGLEELVELLQAQVRALVARVAELERLVQGQTLYGRYGAQAHGTAVAQPAPNPAWPAGGIVAAGNFVVVEQSK